MTRSALIPFCFCTATVWGAAPPAYEAKKPDTWKLSAKVPMDSPARKELIAEWTAPKAEGGEQALTSAEAEAILDDPRAETIYGERTIAIVAPSMLAKQRQEHVDLLKEFRKSEQVDAGAKFYEEHRAALEKAKERHGVDPTVVVSILKWESNLGIETGKYFAFNAFASQAFFVDDANEIALTRRGEKQRLEAERQGQRVATIRERARRNLRVLVRTCKSRGVDPLSVKGSWAGALGYPQFMPASLRWAEDGDGDGKIDLYTFDDSIASIAFYLAEHGYAKSREAAVLSYNHEGAYVKGVLAWADALKERLARAQADAGSASARTQP